ncbi:GumC family protein [Acidobacteriota bacterium]
MDYEEEKKEIDLLQYWRVIIKWKWIVITFACTLLLLVGIFTFTATPLYQANTILLIEDQSSKMMNIEDEFGFSRQISDPSFFNTRINLLTSRALGERVAEKMDLPSRPELMEQMKPKKSLLGQLRQLIPIKRRHIPFLKKKNTEPRPQYRAPSNPYSGYAHMITSNLDFGRVRNTKLVRISFKSPSPRLCAELLNTLAEEFITFSVELRSANTKVATNFMNDSIAQLRFEIEEINRELQRYGEEQDIPMSASETSALSSFQTYEAAYAQARLDTTNALVHFQKLKDLTLDSPLILLEDPEIRQIQSDLRVDKNQYDAQRDRGVGPNLPSMKQLESGIKIKENQLIIAIEKTKEAAETAYQTALETERRYRKLRDEEEAKMGSSAGQRTMLIIKRTTRVNGLEQLESMRESLTVSARLEGYGTSNISLIDKALIPGKPISPNKGSNLLMALIIGIFGGVGLCFLFEYLDNTIKDPGDVEKLTGVSSLGVIPYLPPEGINKKKRSGYLLKFLDYRPYGGEDEQRENEIASVKNIELVNHLHPQFFISEDYRTIRTSILLSNPDHPPKVVLVTSAVPQEGKTTTSTNLAVAFSQLAEKVLIIDADLRKPRLHQIFEVKNVDGLSSYLTGKVKLQDAIKMSAIQNVWIIPCGPIPPNPSELLNSEKMKDLIEEVSAVFDIVIFDTPPVLAAIDTVVLAQLVNSAIMVVRINKTQEKIFIKAVEELKRSRANIIGAVLNEARIDRGAYYYRDYYHYGTGYTHDD